MEKLKIGVVGAGIWGETHGSIYNEHPLAEFSAICDRDISRAEAVAAKYGVREVYSDYREMAQKSHCDAVAVVTPDFLHADIAVAFADAKKDLLIEKPLATNAPDIERICEAVSRNGIRCMVDLHNRWNPPFNKAWQEVKSGRLGTPKNAYIRHSDIKWVATDMLSWAAQSSIMWFLGSHSVDTLRWMFDDEVTRVYSIKSEGILKDLGVDTPDLFLTTLEFSRGGIAQMENGWSTPNGNTNVNDFRFSMLCTKGMVSMDLSSHNLIHLVDENRAYTPDILVTNHVFDRCKGLSYESIRDFVDRLADGKEFRVTLEDARRGALTVLAILSSADKREPVDVRL